MCFQLTQALQLMSSVNNPPHSVASNYGSLRQGLLGTLETLVGLVVHPDTVGPPLVVLGDSNGPHLHQAEQGDLLEAPHMDLWSHSGLWREGSGLLQAARMSPVGSPAQQGEGQASGPRVALVGPTDRPATGLGALTQGKVPGGLGSLVFGGPGPGSPGHDLGGFGGVLGPPSPDSFHACAGQARGGSLTNIE